MNLGVDANCRCDEELSRGVCCCRKGGGFEVGPGLSDWRNRREAGVYYFCEYIDADSGDRHTIGGGTMAAMSCFATCYHTWYMRKRYVSPQISMTFWNLAYVIDQ